MESMLECNEYYGHFAYTPISAVRRLIRAQVRLTYFVQGSTTRLNFPTMRHMFVRSTERASAIRECVYLRPFHEQNDEYAYPIYTDSLPHNVVEAIRFLWNIQCVIGNRDVDALTYLVLCLACHAYTKCLLRPEAISTLNVDTIVERVLRENHSSTIDFFFRTVRQTSTAHTVHVPRRTLTPKELARDIVCRNKSPFLRTLNETVRPANEGDLVRQLTTYIRRHVDVFPMATLTTLTNVTRWNIVTTRAKQRCRTDPP